MKGIVFELKETGVYVMDNEGFFSFVPGFTDHKIGDEIEFNDIPKSKRIFAFLKRLPLIKRRKRNNT